MVGIILAGGSGSRLFPNTIAVSKQLLPVYSAPLLFHPLTMLMKARIKEYVIITNTHNVEPFRKLLGDGSQWGIEINIVAQENPNGIAEAYLLAEPFTKGKPTTLILGDNIFYGCNIRRPLSLFDCRAEGYGTQGNYDCMIFGHKVKDPERYGVLELDNNGEVISVEEKPEKPKSNIAAVGLYVCDETAPDRVRKQKPSARGELEITDLMKSYMLDPKSGLVGSLLDCGTVWLDAGTKRSYVEAIQFVEAVEERSGKMIACPEEIAFKNKFIDEEGLLKIIQEYPQGEYKEYLSSL